MTIIGGGEGRKAYREKVLTPLQEKKRQAELPEVSKSYGALSAELREAIAKRAGVEDGQLSKLTIAQRRALRNAAQEITANLERKAQAARKALMLLVRSCDSN